MTEYQRILVELMASETWLTGLVIMGVGLLSGFYGFRMFRYLVILYCAGLGAWGGWELTKLVDISPPLVMGGLASIAGLLALRWPRPGTVCASAGIWGAVAGYLLLQFGFGSTVVLSAFGVGLAIGLVFAILYPRTTPVLLSTMVGSALIVLGFIGLSCDLLPAVGNTVKVWALGKSPFITMLLIVLTVMAYSVQAMEKQGDMYTGRQDTLPDVP